MIKRISLSIGSASLGWPFIRIGAKRNGARACANWVITSLIRFLGAGEVCGSTRVAVIIQM
jgi:hypothetical protein